MTASRKQWKTRPCDEQTARLLVDALSIPPALARLLAGRGFTAPQDVERFLNPRLREVGDPLALPGMESAARRLLAAVTRRERIAIYGDYDCDGVTSSALLTRTLRALGAEVTPFLPSRLEDGYGFTGPAAQRCIEEIKPALIVTVDCGITAVETVRDTQAHGVDVIVTDHHEPGPEIPPAVAVVNPKLGSGAGAELAGVGVAFKLAHALLKGARAAGVPGADFDLAGLLDLVAIGTVADVAPLTGENRILVKHGLDRLSRTGLPGLEALMEVAGVGETVSAYQLGFVIGPRLNAAGRLSSAHSSLQLLLTEDRDQGLELARVLDATNRERKRVEDEIRKQAEAEIDGWFDPSAHFGLAVGREGWHPGTVGIVASRLCGRYGRPSIVIAFDEEGQGRGSCRSVESVDILEMLKHCAPLLESYGGHKAAAGLSIRKERLAEFQAQFNEACAGTLRGTDLRPVLTVDAWIGLDEANQPLYDVVRRVGPTGVGNPTPVWGARGVQLAAPPRIVGKDQSHVQFQFAGSRGRMSAIGFGMAQREIPEGPMDIVFHLEQNEFNDRTTLQLVLQDFAAS